MSARIVNRNTVTGGRFRALAGVSSLALCMAVSNVAFAQEAPEEEADETETNTIVVSGFRASLQSAQGIKENADTFVDVITAEDIGALPDRSVTEALQRVPGVNIGRFEKPTDPDRFSVEGTGVIIRGLPYVRSELNGREIFSATGGRVLSFEDVSPELLGRVEVFKNVTADMIEGAIAGTVNLVTRKPLDRPGLNIAGSFEMNYGDLREDWSPTYNALISNTFDTGIGTFGLQAAYSNSELRSRTDASQISDPCYRDPSDFSQGCIRSTFVSSGGFGDQLFDATNFPPSGSVIVPQYANVRTTDLNREREAISLIGQFESTDGRFLLTAEYLRSDTTFGTEEFALLGRIDDGVSSPNPAAGSTWTFDENGLLETGVLTQNVGDIFANPFGRGGIPLDALRFVREAQSVTEDFSIDIDMEFSDRFRATFEGQYITSNLTRDSVFGATSTWADIALDLRGSVPDIQFIAPPGSPDDYFTSGFYTYYWFGLDSREANDGELYSLRADFEYDISDGFFRAVRFGGRWSERDRATRNTDFSTWGNLSAPWAGRGGCTPWGEGPGCQPGAQGTVAQDWSGDGVVQCEWGECPGYTPGRFYIGGPFPGNDNFLVPGNIDGIGGGAYIDEFPAYANYRDPFAAGFQRGNSTTPIPGGGAFFYGGDDFLAEYLDGVTDQQWDEITTFGQSPERFNLGVNGRSYTDPITGVTTQCDPFCPFETTDVIEVTKAAYARLDYGHDFANGWALEGNIGLRYVETTVETGGLIGFPNPIRFDDPAGSGNGDGVVTVQEIQDSCQAPAAPGVQRGFCDPSFAPRLAEFAAAYTGEIIDDSRDITFDNWLPSFNARLDFGNGMLVRAAVSKGISRPDLILFRSGGGLGDNTGNLLQAGNLLTGPLFTLRGGNRNLRPVESWNYDLSFEWYFDTVGSLTASVFLKDIEGIVNTGLETRTYTAPSGVTVDATFQGPFNDQSGNLKGFEIAYQQVYDFLPGFLDGLGSQITYTYIDGGDFSNPNLANPGEPSVATGGSELLAGPYSFLQPLAGISEHTVNATMFYERGPLALRAAYNWRSAFLITPRDDIFPFSPIWQEDTGQLDASIFYSVTDDIKVGVQAVNLLDEVTETSQVIDFDGTRVTRSSFRNDRRFTFLVRFDF
ncbi:TonB-dependent receptor [Aurantiacibacter sp. MUD11]|uniref:TonB-dependent receptor domain-containing protein n=1 Tax=Aurantiacibacter sp. MUD11 TaxID=3003265 RepID=UPI0022AA3816|nr:TonB-dependent receptor [Aurantiacibacter sp. MUD11]WAT17555.1 TonB-dependent receptor [Aurantiacibacter sp. MUD11]